MLNCLVVLAETRAQSAADVPAASMAGIERDGAVDEGDGRADVFAGKTEDVSRVGEHARILVAESQCLLDQSQRLAAARLRVLRPSVETEPEVADAGPGKRRTIARIAGDRAIEQLARLEQLLLGRPRKTRQCPQVEIVSGQVLRRAL